MRQRITRIGAIYQDVIAKGFLKGLKSRLGCDAELVAPGGQIGATRTLTRRQARNAWLYLCNERCEVVVRFTDADGFRWQDVNRGEYEAFPEDARTVLVCGTAMNNTEDWLALDLDWMAERLGLDSADLRSREDRSSAIKAAIRRKAQGQEAVEDFVQRLVEQAPPQVFHCWLQDPALNDFYQKCRSIASAHDCDTRNEL